MSRDSNPLFLSGIELNNFKSYSGTVLLSPLRGFNCIVGPNGSGKSNLMDAIGFVLSASFDASRVHSGVDFIHSGKKECRVTLILRPSSEKDGTSGQSLGNQRVHSSGLRLSRYIRLSSASELVSNVLVNGREVSTEAFHQTLQRLHLSGQLHSFLVYQNDVDLMARRTPQQLRELLESLSDSSGDIRRSFLISQKQFAECSRELRDAVKSVRTARQETAELSLQQKEASQWSNVNAELLQKQRELALTELCSIEQQLQRARSDEQRAQRRVNELELKVSSLKTKKGEDDGGNKSETPRQSLAATHRLYLESIKAARESHQSYRNSSGTLGAIKATKAKLESRLKRLQQEKVSAKKLHLSRNRHRQQTQKLLEKQRALLSQLEESWKAEDDAAAAEGASLAALPSEQRAHYEELRTACDCETLQTRQNLSRKQRGRDSLRIAQRQLAEQLDGITRAKQQAEDALNDCQRRGGELQERMDERKTLEAQTRGELEEYQVKKEQQMAEKDEREIKQQRLESKLRELRVDREQQRHCDSSAEILESLRHSFPSGCVLGRLVELCEVKNPQTYRAAVTVAFGSHLEAILVDTMETAVACVRLLKDKRAPPQTFLPLSTLKAPQLRQLNRHIVAFGAQYAVDLVSCDPSVAPAVRFALGQTLFCNSLSKARALAFGQVDQQRHKVVTRDGSLLQRSGAIQGGLDAVRKRTKRWDEPAYRKVKAEYDALLLQSSSVGSMSLHALQQREGEIRTRLIYLTTQRAQLDETAMNEHQKLLKSFEADIRRLTHNEKTLRTQKKTVDTSLTRSESECQSLEQTLREAETEFFRDFEQETGLCNLAGLERRQAGKERERASQRESLRVQIGKLERLTEGGDAVSFTGSRTIQIIQKDEEQTIKQLQETSDDLTQSTQLVQSYLNKAKKAQAEIIQRKLKLDQLQQVARERGQETSVQLRQLAAARLSHHAAASACDTFRQSRLSLYQQCLMEDIDIPTRVTMADGESGENTSQRTSKRPRSNPPSVFLSEPFNLGPPFSTSNDSVQLVFTTIPEPTRDIVSTQHGLSEFKRQSLLDLSAMEEQLENMTPNHKASKTRVALREANVAELAQRVEQRRSAALEASTNFLEIRQTRMTRFTAMLEAVNARLGPIYSEMTHHRSTVAQHGLASLQSDHPDEPFVGGVLYHANPPLKRFMRLDQLSGGERTMAALALVFAIHSVSGTPFLVLDEVDAALDTQNVKRLSQFLQRHSSAQQWVVISLKPELFSVGQLLVGVYKDPTGSSSTILYDLDSATASEVSRRD